MVFIHASQERIAGQVQVNLLMKIYLATDHAGFDLKGTVKAHLLEKGYTIEDCGAQTFDKNDDYPDIIAKAARKISQNPNDRAIIFGGSGQGEAIVANKFANVRAVVFYAPRIPPMAADAAGRVSEDPYEMLRLTREHNNANVLSLGARMLTEEEAREAVDVWLTTEFPNESRHARRIEKIHELEVK